MNKTRIFISEGSEPLINSQMRLESLESLGKEYENVFFTFIPAKEYQFFSEKNDTEQINNEMTTLINFPLIKLKEKNFEDSQNEFLCGYLSGKRSIIMFTNDNSAVRLKGCGNNYIGFNLANVDIEGPNHFEIRGTQFKNTCLRELDITSKVNNALLKNDLIPGNIPIGFWLYDNCSQKYKSLGLKNDCPLIDKYCSIYFTNGDKRLGMNFFSGLNVFFNCFFTNKNFLEFFVGKIINLKNLSTLLKENQFQKEPFFLLFNEEIYKCFEKQLKHYNKESPNEFFNFLSHFNKFLVFDEEFLNLENKLIHNYILTKRDSIKSKEKLKSIKTFSEELNKTISLFYEKLRYKKVHLFHLILTVLSNICYEIGKIKRLLELEDINWGTFDYHSNAHLDNFLLLPPNSKNLYLAPVDFDLAFTREQFCDLKYKNKKNLNEFDFDSLIRSEKNNLIFQISGLNTISNLEVKVFDFGEDNDLTLSSIRNLLIENNNYYFTKGYLNKYLNEDQAIFDEYYALGQEFIRIILKIEALTRIN
jgi:hypothetical protein